MKKLIFFGILFSLSFAFPNLKEFEKENKKLDPSLLNTTKKKDTLQTELKYLNLFMQGYEKVKNNYVVDKSAKELFENALRGMLQKLDPYSTLFTPQELKDFTVETEGKFGGLGIEITKAKGGGILVITPIEGTPAWKAGIMPGDIIVKVDNTTLGPDISVMKAVHLMRGKPGTKVTIWIKRKGWDKPRPFTLTRAIIKIKSVKYKTLNIKDKKIGYIKVSQFQENTPEEFKKALKELLYKEGVKGLIIDMRFNPGGLLSSALSMVDLFIPKDKVIVKVKGKAEYEVYKSQEPVFVPKHIPIVILVNQATASAAEIFTGSLKDYNRAIVVGEKTFGKGCVQNIFSLPYGYAVKLTTAYYYLPKGECIQGKGIKPDIEVKLSKKDKEFLKKIKEKERENPEKILEYKRLRENYVDEQLKKAMEVLDRKLEEING